MGVENVLTKVPTGTPLRQIWLNKLFGVGYVVVTVFNATRIYTDQKRRIFVADF